MTITHIDDVMEFGKYKGSFIFEVITKNPSYIGWLVENVSGERFAIEDSGMREILDAFPDFIWTSAQEMNRVRQLEEQLEKYIPIDEHECEEDYPDYTANEDCHYGAYAGTYAQDVAGYSDEEIISIFDGEPDAYWNID